MIDSLKSLVELLTSAATMRAARAKGRKRADALVTILAAQMVIVRIANNARALIDRLGTHPQATLDSLVLDERRRRIEGCQLLLIAQEDRILRLQGLLNEAALIDILDSRLRRMLDDCMRDKVGVIRFAYDLHPHTQLARNPKYEDESYLELASSGMTALLRGGDESEKRRALSELDDLADRLSKVCREIATAEEIVELAARAEAVADRSSSATV